MEKVIKKEIIKLAFDAVMQKRFIINIQLKRLRKNQKLNWPENYVIERRLELDLMSILSDEVADRMMEQDIEGEYNVFKDLGYDEEKAKKGVAERLLSNFIERFRGTVKFYNIFVFILKNREEREERLKNAAITVADNIGYNIYK